jgi:uncharacterized protein (DUF697 family)
MGVKHVVGRQLAPRIAELAPGMTTLFVRESLIRAIDGVGPLPPAAKAADKQLREQKGDVNRAIHEVIENNVRLAGAQGFVTNLGGLVTAGVAIPVNITGLALIQCRMIAGIAHLRGYDLADPRTRDAILACLLGEEKILRMVKSRALPGTPMEIAAAPAHDPALDQRLGTEVGSELVARATGKRLAATVGRRVPVVGGVVGAGTDAFVTWRIGRYVDREFLPRKRR